MVKLQLRLDRAQAETIIDALTRLAHAPQLPEHLADAPKLASWLRWRSDKIWGMPSKPLDTWCAQCAEIVSEATGKCRNGHAGETYVA